MEYYVNLRLICYINHRMAINHWKRFGQSCEREELDKSIFHARIALGLCHEELLARPYILNSLGCYVYGRFKQSGRIEDLDEAIELHYTALELCPDGHPDRSMCLHHIGKSLVARFYHVCRIEDLNIAIEHHRAALKICPDDHPDRSIFLEGLAGSLNMRFEQHGRAEDLREAVQHQRTALNLLPGDDPDRFASLGGLSICLQNQFEQYGRITDLDDAIKYSCTALKLCPNSHPSRFASMDIFGTCLLFRFQEHGRTEDLNEAIGQFRTALGLCPCDSPGRSMCLNHLGISLFNRFEQLGCTTDIDEAIDYFSAALELNPNSNFYRLWSLDNLACSLRSRYQQHGRTADLDESIKYGRTALEICPDGHPSLSIYLNNVASSFSMRFEKRGQAEDIDEAIKSCHAALKLQPEGNPYRLRSLCNLASAYGTRFERLGQTADLYKAIKHYRTAMKLCHDGHPGRCILLRGLAYALCARYKKFGGSGSFEEGMQLFECAIQYEFSGLVHRLETACLWASLARSYAHHTTSKAYQAAILLHHRALVVIPTIHAQHNFLKEKTDKFLTSHAASYAIEGGRLEEAIEILEQGRGLLWSQMRGFRTPLERLAETDGELADRFRKVSVQLENLAIASTGLQTVSNTSRGGPTALNVHNERGLFDDRLKLKRQLSNEQEELINDIRQIPGFENFLAATPFKVLRRAASEGPVVMVNICKYRSDALIVLSNEDDPVVHVPLDGEFYEDSLKLYAKFLVTRANSKVYSLEYDAVLRRVMRMLWDRVVSKIVTKLEELRIPKGTRIWWCPTFVLSAFPFHAAGPFEGADGTMKYFLDDYISSYTPTLGALVNARSREPENISNPAMLVIGDTVTLTSTRTEVTEVRKNTQRYISSYTEFLNERATRGRVLKHLHKVTWVHFACHGHLGSGSLDSSFKLSDGGLTLLDIMRANIPNAEFAFLSACHTAEQDPYALHDEVLHLAAAVQFCGFRSVIGTMWEMYDPDGPLLAEEVYSYMAQYKDGEVIHKRSAAALRKAVLKLRKEEGVQTEQWVNLVHIGA